MPYVKQTQRDNIDPAVSELANRIRLTSQQDSEQPDGMVNYAVTRLLLNVMTHELRYVTLERAVGCLECCKLELYRRLGAPYEDQKAKANGEVYL